MSSNEEIVWKSTPSQIVNFFTYLFFFWTIIIPIIAYLKTRFTIYELSSQRLKIKTGILNQTINELELYRVRDYQIHKPFILRIFNLGHLILITSDKTDMTIKLDAIADVENVSNLIRNQVEAARERTKTRETDFT